MPDLVTLARAPRILNTEGHVSRYSPARAMGNLILAGHPVERATAATNALSRVLAVARLDRVSTHELRHFLAEYLAGATEEVAARAFGAPGRADAGPWSVDAAGGRQAAAAGARRIGGGLARLLPHLLADRQRHRQLARALPLLEARIVSLAVARAAEDDRAAAAAAARQRIEATWLEVASGATSSRGEAEAELERSLVEQAREFYENADLDDGAPAVPAAQERWYLEEYLVAVFCKEETPPTVPLADDLVIEGEYLYGGSQFDDYPDYEHEFDSGDRHTLDPELRLGRVEIRPGMHHYFGSKVVYEDDLMSAEDARDVSSFLVWLLELLLGAAKDTAVDKLGDLANPGLPPSVWEKIRKKLQDKIDEGLTLRIEQFSATADGVISGWLGPELFPLLPCTIATRWAPPAPPAWSSAYQGEIAGEPTSGQGAGVVRFPVVPLDRQDGGKYRFNLEFRLVKERA